MLLPDALAALRPNGLSYWDLHGFLLVPTLWLLTVGKPSVLAPEASQLKRQSSQSFLAFILAIAVAQAFVWDSVGAQIGIWEFNSEKTTQALGAWTLLPLEEVLWLFHHVVKAALWQLKIADFEIARQEGPAPARLPGEVRVAGNVLLSVLGACGVAALLSDVDSAKCVGLVAAFFAPVLLLIFNLGERYFASHARLFLAGWAPPGWWTVAIDALGQQQNVWNFPPQYLTGADLGYLKLDIASVYLVSTFAVTGTGAIILAATEELDAKRGPAEPEPTLVELGAFIFENAFPGLIPGQAPSGSRAGGFAAQAAPAEVPEETEREERESTARASDDLASTGEGDVLDTDTLDATGEQPRGQSKRYLRK